VVARNASVLTGLDALAEERFAPLRPYRVGLITNQTGLDRNARPSAGRMLEAGVRLAALFSPSTDSPAPRTARTSLNTKDPPPGSPSGASTRRPTAAPRHRLLREIDALVFDIQDIGARFTPT